MDAFPRVACPVRGKRHAPLYDDASAHRTLASVPEVDGTARQQPAARWHGVRFLIVGPVKTRTIAGRAS
ncbi:hypothetical protein [Burkholderia seminalis]|uniref:hypothetical protein n=1 Tax=Burkholderia seminalis TaxID=488731 RepID=UPI001CF5C699|nr:hypothetical protein [Burkholderia seminalis]